jgi:hypothetical protein
MEPCKIRGTAQPRLHAQGLEGKEISSPSGRGRKMSLTSPLIDRDLTSTKQLQKVLTYCLAGDAGSSLFHGVQKAESVCKGVIFARVIFAH